MSFFPSRSSHTMIWSQNWQRPAIAQVRPSGLACGTREVYPSDSMENPVVYSHGGSGADGSITGPGSPIDIFPATEASAISITIDQGSAVVELNCHFGPPNNDGELDERDWIDTSNGGWTITPGRAGGLAKKLPNEAPYWRTYISDIQGGGLVKSKMSRVEQGGEQRPLPKNPGRYFATPYDR